MYKMYLNGDWLMLTGCLRKVFVNGRMMDFSATPNSHYKLTPGCPRYDRSNPCESHMCKNGKCRALKGMSYKCECQRGYSGPMCDMGKNLT